MIYPFGGIVYLTISSYIKLYVSGYFKFDKKGFML
jgi:hypothetical protein